MLEITPVTLREARAYVELNHRHHKAPAGGIFAIAASDRQTVRGVVIVGRPVARGFQDSWTAEVIRLCTDGTKNACSMLYGAAWRAARAMGYKRIVTYTLAEEPGTSLKAAGWRVLHKVRGRSWDCRSRPRVDEHPLQDKLCWTPNGEKQEIGTTEPGP